MSYLSETRTYLMNKKCCPVNCESVEENREENQIFWSDMKIKGTVKEETNKQIKAV